MKTYLARVKTRVANDAGLVAVEYLGIAILVLAVLTAVLVFLPGSVDAIGAALDTVITEIFGLRP